LKGSLLLAAAALYLAAALAAAAHAQAPEGYLYIIEYGVFTPEGVPLGAGRIVYPLGGEPSVVYAAGVAASPEALTAIIDAIVQGLYEPTEPVPDLEPLFPVVAYSVQGSTLPAICSLEEAPVTGVALRAPGGGAVTGNTWIAPAAGVPVAGALIGDAPGGPLLRADFYLGQAPSVVCGVMGSPLAAALAGLLSGVILFGGIAVLASRFLRGSLTRPY